MSGNPITSPSVDGMAESAKSIKTKGLPPVHLWNPPFKGDLDIVIKRDGSWFHEGGRINREGLVRLFASILKLEDGKYFLVTPVEKVGITVEDVPFIAIDVNWDNATQTLVFETNTGDNVLAGKDNSIRLDLSGDDPQPYVMVRSGLEARLDRKTFYRVIDLGVHHEGWFGVWSAGEFFKLMPSDEVEG